MPDDFIDALTEAHRAHVASDPTNPMPLYWAAGECRARGDVAGWKAAVDAALQLPHRTHEARYARAWTKLELEDWSAWEDYESRIYVPDQGLHSTKFVSWVRWTHVRWDGVEDLTDLTLLVLLEQGQGDAIQMLRFLPWLASKAKRVVVLAYPRLVPLIQHNFGDRVLVAITGVEKPFAFDRYVFSMSLPALFGGIPTFAPIHASHRRRRLPPRTRPVRGGICWAGNPDYGADEARSMPAGALASLIERSDVEWHSLQVGTRTGDADRYPSLLRPWPPLITYGDTADFIAELDLVVTVDTSVGHLAGYLGQPTIVLLSHIADQRWGSGDRTPWYPTMRLLRQREPGEWDGAIKALHEELDALIANRLLTAAESTHAARAEERSYVSAS